MGFIDLIYICCQVCSVNPCSRYCSVADDLTPGQEVRRDRSTLEGYADKSYAKCIGR